MTGTNILLNDNKNQRERTGVQKFHDAGYYGQRVCAASGEQWSIKTYNPDNLVFDPLEINSNRGANDHSVKTAATFFQAAPKAKLYMLYSITGNYKGNGVDYTNKFLEQSVDIIEKYNITNMFVSLNGSKHKKYFEDLTTWLQAHPNFKYFWAAGNDDTLKYNKMLEINEITGVAAYTLMVDGKMNPAHYSSETEYVDFAAPANICININATSPSSSGGSNAGTSFATPWLCGMACLVDDFFIDKTGRPLTRDAMMQFFKDHTVDIGDKGFDDACGWGAVVLPDPSEIDIKKYAGDKTMLDNFKDKDLVSDWAKDSAEFCLIKNIIDGKGNNILDPKGTLTREEMFCIIQRLYNFIKEGV